MADSAPQSFATHRRFDPPYHLVLFVILVANFLHAGRQAFKVSSSDSWMGLLLAFGLMILYLKARTYPLRAQDRVIRLEETLRMRALLPTELQARIPELRPGQFVALRFASDEELPALVEATLQEGLGAEAIKKRIKTWRPDHFRV